MSERVNALKQQAIHELVLSGLLSIFMGVQIGFLIYDFLQPIHSGRWLDVSQIILLLLAQRYVARTFNKAAYALKLIFDHERHIEEERRNEGKRRAKR